MKRMRLDLRWGWRWGKGRGNSLGKGWGRRWVAHRARILLALSTAALVTLFGAGWIAEAASHEAGRGTETAAGAGTGVLTGAASGSGTRIRVQVGHEGFKVLDGGALEARAGERVEITFVYGDGDLGHDNPHQVYFPTLDLKSGVLNEGNQESTVSFTATETGKIPMKCVRQCEGHKLLQNGFLTVDSAAAKAQPSRIQVVGAAGKAGIEISAALQAETGEPLKGARVLFYRAGSFLGAEGVKLGAVLTDANGIARLAYTPRREGDIEVRAVFEGNAAYRGGEAISTVEVPQSAVNRYEFEPRDLYIPFLGNWTLAAILAFVWTVFSYSVISGVRTRWARAGLAAAAATTQRLAGAAAREAHAMGGTHGGASVWAADDFIEEREEGDMNGTVWKVAVGVVALLLALTWIADGFRANAEHEQRIAAEGQIRGDLAVVAQGLQSLEREIVPLSAKQDRLAALVAGLQENVESLTQLKATIVQVDQRVQELRTEVLASRTPAATTAKPAEPALKEIPLTAYHFGWDPGKVEVKKGDRVRLLVNTDSGRLSPGLLVKPAGQDLDKHGIGIEAYGIEQEVPSGKEVAVEFTADKTGEFPIVCTVWCGIGELQGGGGRRGHPDMVGTLIVK
ncbi:MAG: hypothetical protein HYY09_06835 [Firmicutes bacterium]|nr:hypothetical protein [Bacillota bacterium]